jgi:hypothetical protein
MARSTTDTPDIILRENARSKVAGAAKRGELPSETWPADDLAWAYEGHEAELAELEELAKREAERQAQQAADPPHLRAVRLRAETDRVLAEWDAQRRAEATAEARRRLGLEDA